MSDTDHKGAPPPETVPTNMIRRRFIVGFGIFAIFFVFYLGTAILQTPAFRQAATAPCLGMPLGLFLSLMIFPVSWILIIIFFLKSR